jgi:hypothetical protein
MLLSEPRNTLFSLARRAAQEDWDGLGSAAASIEAVHAAHAALGRFYDELGPTAANWWLTPHISLDESGFVIFEWWFAQKKLTVRIEPNLIFYIKVWGVNMDTEMEDGQIQNGGMLPLWRWLIR